MSDVTKEDVLRFRKIVEVVHEQIINVSGGLNGTRDEGGLDHALYTCLSMIEKTPEKTFRNAAEAYKLFATRHYFNDGNKRTAHMFVKLYLLTHNIHLELNYKDAVQFIIEIASNKKTVDEIEQWLEIHSSKLFNLTDYLNEFENDIKEMRKYMENRGKN